MPYRKLIAAETLSITPQDMAKTLQEPYGPADLIKDELRTLIRRAEFPGGLPTIVKTYRHRSAYDFCRESLTRFRAQREFEALSFLFDRRIPCSRPVGWGYGSDRESGRFETLVTVEEPDVIGLKDHLRSGTSDGSWIEPVAELVRRAHEAGFYHGALAPRNILVRFGQQGSSCFFIDTPKSLVFRRPVTGTRMAIHDLLVFLCEVNNVAGDTPVGRFLVLYGMGPSDIPRMVSRVKRYRAGRNTRNRMRAEFLLRRLVS